MPYFIRIGHLHGSGGNHSNDTGNPYHSEASIMA
jgi:hypothetical protein